MRVKGVSGFSDSAGSRWRGGGYAGAPGAAEGPLEAVAYRLFPPTQSTRRTNIRRTIRPMKRQGHVRHYTCEELQAWQEE
jgi:hypothetical protein